MSDFDNLKVLLLDLANSANNIERECIQYGEIKAKLQLEIYKLMKDNSTDDIVKIINENVSSLDKSTDTKKILNKFFKEK